MTACGFDADVILSGLADDAASDERARVEEHLGACATCRAAAAVHGRARRAWNDEMVRDDAFARARRELRLFAPRRTRTPMLGPLAYVALGAAIALLGVDLWTRRGAPGLPPPSAGAPQAAQASVPAGANDAVGTVHLHAPLPVVRAVVIRNCAGCVRASGAAGASSDPVAAGSAMDSASAIDVPRGATLLVGWGVTDGVVESTSGVDVTGPARVRAAADAAGAIVLDQGTATADTRTRGEVRTAIVRTVGDNASWRVEVVGDRTQIEVLRGTVSVEGGPGGPRILSTGERLGIEPPSRVARPVVTDVDPTAPLPLPPPPAARGAEDAAAFDAARSAALAAGSNRDAIAVWRRYLAQNPGRPHADVAMAELANVLLDMGNAVEARVVVDALAARPSVPEAEAGLDRARGRLLSHAATECLAHDLRTVCREAGAEK